MIEATDQSAFAYKDSVGPDEPCPDPGTMRPLIELYMRYLHPTHYLVDDKVPDFWTRLERPMEPGVASIVYAMCTIGAVFKSIPGSGCIDGQVQEFYRRTCAAQDGRPQDIITIQTYLIIHTFFVLTLQADEANKSFKLALDIAENIKLGEAVQKLRSKDRLSPGEAIVRNTWKLLIWNETFASMNLAQSRKLDPMKDLSSRALDARPEEVPTARSSVAETMNYHFGSLFKVFQRVTKIKLPMSPRDVHAVNSMLDELTSWHCSLPRFLRSNSSRSQSTIGTGAISPYAVTLDLYYRLGHILLLNNLPHSIRSSPTGLGPRRESPLRILATSANSITATMGDMIKDPDLSPYCLAHGVRCLTEAATIQLSNSKESDPAISTPAKINIMKTLWCIRQFNFTVPVDVLSAVLEPYDSVSKGSSSTHKNEKDRTHSMTVDISWPRTPSVSAMSVESPTSSIPSRGGREFSMASDYSSSAASTREGSHLTIYELDEVDRERPFRLQASPSQDGAAASLLALSLESPTGTIRPGVPFDNYAAESGGGPVFARDVQGPAKGDDVMGSGYQSTESLTKQLHGLPSREELADERHSMSSISVPSPRTSTNANDPHSMQDAQLPLTTVVPHSGAHLPHHLRTDNHLPPLAAISNSEEDALESRQFFVVSPHLKNTREGYTNGSNEVSSGYSRDALVHSEILNSSQDQPVVNDATSVGSRRQSLSEDEGILSKHIMLQKPLPSMPSSAYGTHHGSESSTPPNPKPTWLDDTVVRSSLRAGDHLQDSTSFRVPAHALSLNNQILSSTVDPTLDRAALLREGDSEKGLQEPLGLGARLSSLQRESGKRIRRAEKLHLTTVFPSHPYKVDKRSPRTPMSASSEIERHGFKQSSTQGSRNASMTSESLTVLRSVDHHVISVSARSPPSISPIGASTHAASRPSFCAEASSPSSQQAEAQADSDYLGCEQEHHLNLSHFRKHPYDQQHQHPYQHSQFRSTPPARAHDVIEHGELSLHRRHITVGRTNHDDYGRKSALQSASPSPIPAGFVSSPSPQSPRRIQGAVRASSCSRRSSSGNWQGSPTLSTGATEGRVGMFPAPIPEDTPTGLNKTPAVTTVVDASGPGPSYSSSPRIMAGRKRPSVSMYGPSGLDDMTGHIGSHGDGWTRDIVGEGSGKVRALPMAYNADPLHQDGTETVRLRERHAGYVHQQSRDQRRRGSHDAGQQAKIESSVHVDMSVSQHSPEGRSSHRHDFPQPHTRYQRYYDSPPSRPTSAPVSPHVPPPLISNGHHAQRGLYQDPHPYRHNRHDVGVPGSYISSPNSPDDNAHGTLYTYPQISAEQQHVNIQYRHRQHETMSQNQQYDEDEEVQKQQQSRLIMPPPEYYYPNRRHRQQPHDTHHHYHNLQHHQQQQQPMQQSSHQYEEDDVAGIADLLRDPIRRKYH
ncbi:hypothetical protein BGX28_006236 [Mortierella sp. GBA30]|nr:hypothetical protein BGX28_006236 [Mortierella sp. GBA30]